MKKDFEPIHGSTQLIVSDWLHIRRLERELGRKFTEEEIFFNYYYSASGRIEYINAPRLIFPNSFFNRSKTG